MIHSNLRSWLRILHAICHPPILQESHRSTLCSQATCLPHHNRLKHRLINSNTQKCAVCVFRCAVESCKRAFDERGTIFNLQSRKPERQRGKIFMHKPHKLGASYYTSTVDMVMSDHHAARAGEGAHSLKIKHISNLVNARTREVSRKILDLSISSSGREGNIDRNFYENTLENRRDLPHRMHHKYPPPPPPLCKCASSRAHPVLQILSQRRECVAHSKPSSIARADAHCCACRP